MAAGRPTKYDIKYCDVALNLMKKGFSKAAVAGKLGISRDTLYQWCKTNPEFSDTIKRGETASEYYWSKILHDATTGKNSKANPTLLIFYMKSRFGWKDRPYKEDFLDEFLSQPEPDPIKTQTETERVKKLLERHAIQLVMAAQIKDMQSAKQAQNPQ